MQTTIGRFTARFPYILEIEALAVDGAKPHQVKPRSNNRSCNAFAHILRMITNAYLRIYDKCLKTVVRSNHKNFRCMKRPERWIVANLLSLLVLFYVNYVKNANLRRRNLHLSASQIVLTFLCWSWDIGCLL